MTQTGVAKGPSDQKTLNEEIIEGLVEVARRNPQHAVELFGVPRWAWRCGWPHWPTRSSTTWPPRPWRCGDPRSPSGWCAGCPSDGPCSRPTTRSIARWSSASTGWRWPRSCATPTTPPSAALVCDITDREVIRALQELPAFAFLEWGGNPGTLLAVPRLSDALIDRLLRTEDDGVEPGPARPAGAHAVPASRSSR